MAGNATEQRPGEPHRGAMAEAGRMAERSPEDIQRDIEQARVSLAGAVDQIAYRTSPKRVSEQRQADAQGAGAEPAGHGRHRRSRRLSSCCSSCAA